MRKERNMRQALTMLAVNGHSSSNRLFATLSRFGVLFAFERVKSGMKKCSPAQRRKMKLNPANTSKVLRAMLVAP